MIYDENQTALPELARIWNSRPVSDGAIVGLSRGLDLLFRARWIDPDTALQWGLVNYVVEPDERGNAALKYCSKLAMRSRIGIAAMKRLALQGLGGSLETGWKPEGNLVSGAPLDDDVSEGLTAIRSAPHTAVKVMKVSADESMRGRA